ncbi:hypothetical protein [Virgisporangium aurantiacum]|uniref:Uncharacterized protein n=1 Tax=Virgisporangium aurantiacum TaxID=175570 RepID=A0A8J3ZEV7_9ACTN|nr:hypothetical protein [Virgisporangium aurantiacum]GIJ62626.1 hypothetical protein Vau01_101420 [Virgisporangium aurantiacum]
MTGRLVFPVGRYLGMLPIDRPSGPTLEHVVRIGGRRMELSADEHLVWALAHGVPGAPDLDRWDRAAMRANLPDRSADTDVDGIADRLLGVGLLRELDGPVEEFARSVRLLPQAVGLGNGGADGRTFWIGFPGSPLVSLSSEIFYVWSWAGLEPDLYAACVRATTVGLPLGDRDPRVLVAAVVGDLHALLAPNVACLDATLAPSASPAASPVAGPAAGPGADPAASPGGAA